MFDFFEGEGLDYWCSEREITHSSVHWHKFHEVELILAGEGIEFINGVPHEISGGYLTAIPPGSFHGYDVSSEKMRIITVCFTGSFLSSEINQKTLSSGLPWLFKLDTEKFEKTKAWFNILNTAIHTESDNRSDIVKRIIEVVLLSCSTNDENLAKTENQHDSQKIAIVRSVLNYIDEHYAEKISRDSLADALHYSPCYFSTMFHKLSGVTLSQYITNTRMNKAKELLCNSDIPISEIIKNVGYRSESLFYGTFRKYFGMNPNEMRHKSDS